MRKSRPNGPFISASFLIQPRNLLTNLKSSEQEKSLKNSKTKHSGTKKTKKGWRQTREIKIENKWKFKRRVHRKVKGKFSEILAGGFDRCYQILKSIFTDLSNTQSMSYTKEYFRYGLTQKSLMWGVGEKEIGWE